MILKDAVLKPVTNSGGAATYDYPGGQVRGFLYAIEYVKDTLDIGVDLTISVQDTPSGVAKVLLTLTDANANAFYNPREDEHGNTGVATGGKCYPLIFGIPRVVVASGGNVKTGKVILYYFS